MRKVSKVGVDDLRLRLRLRADVLQSRDVVQRASNQRESGQIVSIGDIKSALITSIGISSSVFIVEHVRNDVGHSGLVQDDVRSQNEVRVDAGSVTKCRGDKSLVSDSDFVFEILYNSEALSLRFLATVSVSLAEKSQAGEGDDDRLDHGS